MYRRWVKLPPEVLRSSSQELAKEIAKRCMQVAVLGFNLRSPMNEDPRFFELVKLYVFETSDCTLFARSVRLSSNKSQLLVEIVASAGERSRNYFARRAADSAKILPEVVRTATAISVAYNTGALQVNQGWTPPCDISDADLPYLQLLTIIFTNERAVCTRSETGSLLLLGYDPHAGIKLICNLYEHFLLVT